MIYPPFHISSYYICHGYIYYKQYCAPISINLAKYGWVSCRKGLSLLRFSHPLSLDRCLLGSHSKHLVAVLENCRDALTTTDAHSNERPFSLMALEPIQSLYCQNGTSCANWMAQCNRPAIRIHPLGVQLRLAHDWQGLCRKGLIQLNHIQVIGTHTHRCQHTADRIDGSYAHDLWFNACDRHRC